MIEKVNSGEAIDLSKNETKDGFYILKQFVDGADYCDLKNETWIWSIGKNYKTGQILASTDTVFYQNPDFECLWLR